MNKRFLLITSCFFIVTVYWSCSKKTFTDALPQVQFVSVTPYGNDSAIIAGNVTSAGASPVEYVGFAFSANSSVDLLKNQVLLNGTTGRFSAGVKVYHDSTYYFKCFAANSFGYAASAAFKCTIGSAVGDSAPCALNSNYIVDGGYGGYSIVSLNTGPSYASYGGSFGVYVDNGSSTESVDICFNGSPGNGTYNSVSSLSFDTNPYDCEIVVNGSYVVNAGGKVYVSVKSGKTTISFCPITYIGTSTYSISGKITY